MSFGAVTVPKGDSDEHLEPLNKLTYTYSAPQQIRVTSKDVSKSNIEINFLSMHFKGSQEQTSPGGGSPLDQSQT